MNKIEIINETVEYYKTHNRAISLDPHGNFVCHYINSAGDMCAVGRCLIDPIDIRGDVYFICPDDGLDTILKEEYRGHDIGFWNELQKIHDRNYNWCGNDLSLIGIGFVNSLKELYND